MPQYAYNHQPCKVHLLQHLDVCLFPLAIQVDAERIKELYGGGDWHMAYMCLFRKMETTSLEVPKD